MRHLAVFAFCLVALFGGGSATALRPDLGAAGQAAGTTTSWRITASTDVQKVLDQARAATGDTAKLKAVRSLLVEGERSFGRLPPEKLTYRILLPARFQKTKEQAGGRFVFTLVGDNFSQTPKGEPKVTQLARRNALAEFGELCLTLLLQAPSILPMEAVTDTPSDATRRAVTFLGPEGFSRTLEFDLATSRLMALGETGLLGEQRVTRQLAFVEYKEFGGLLFPVRIIEKIAATTATITLTAIRVNEGVTVEDFAVAPSHL
jgi:hypothetical protein